MTVSEEELTQLRTDSAVLRLAIAQGYLTNDDAAELQLEVTDDLWLSAFTEVKES